MGQATVDAVFPTARDPLNFRQHLDDGLEPWKVAELYLWSTNEANQLVDIGATLERKVAALAHHASQFRHSTTWRAGSGGAARSWASAPATARPRASGA